MDRTCSNCKHTTDDGEGRCRFCGAPFPAVQEPAVVPPLPDPSSTIQ